MNFKKVLKFYIKVFIFMNLGLWTNILIRKKAYDLDLLIFASIILPAISTIVWFTDKNIKKRE